MASFTCCLCGKVLKRKELDIQNRIVPYSKNMLCNACYSKKMVLMGKMEALPEQYEEYTAYFYEKRNEAIDQTLQSELDQIIEQGKLYVDEQQAVLAEQQARQRAVLAEQQAAEEAKQEKITIKWDQYFNETDDSWRECNDIYEYRVETIGDNIVGKIDTNFVQECLTEYAKRGWRLRNSLVKEIGKNAVGVAGVGVNRTIEQVILIFERRVPSVYKRTNTTDDNMYQ